MVPFMNLWVHLENARLNHMQIRPYWVVCVLVVRVCGSIGGHCASLGCNGPSRSHIAFNSFCIWMHMRFDLNKCDLDWEKLPILF